MSASPSILIVGGASLDVLHVDGVPTESAGGAGLYTALAAARAGAGVTMLAPRPDPMPDLLAPAAQWINWIGPTVTPDRMPRFEISYGPGGGVTRFDEFMGAEPELTPHLLDGVAPLPEWAYSVPFMDAALQLAFVEALQARGCRVVAGTYGCAVRDDTETVRRTFETADVFFCNEDEARVLFGSIERAGTKPGRLLFVTLGAAGVRVFQGDHATELPTVAVATSDPTGAGDTFCGTTLAHLARGSHPVEAARAATVAAACEVTGIGPARMLDPKPIPLPSADQRVRIDDQRVAALAALIAGLDGFEPFDFTGDLFPDPGDPGALDFFFSATLQQWGFWFEQNGRWSHSMVAPINGTILKGSDFLWAAYLRWFQENPDGLTPAGQLRAAGDEFSDRMAGDDGRNPLPESATAAGLAAAYGRTMREIGWSPADVVAMAADSAAPIQLLLRMLDHIGGYREDPLRKKSALLGVILRQRPEQWLPTVDGDDAPPIVDYHVQRTCLRTGLIRVVDEELRLALTERRLLNSTDEEAIRRAGFEAVQALVTTSGRTMGAVDWFLFGMRRRCPEAATPDCSRCPVESACGQFVEFFQPVRRTTFY